MPQVKPAILLAFANDRDDRERYLRNLPEEVRSVRQALDSGRADGLWDVVTLTNATIDDVLDVFQNPEYRDRIAIFHFGGHAGSYQLLFESASGHPSIADGGGLAAFLGQQRGLQLAFLNGCSTGADARGLLNANLSAVIATSRSIDDQVATGFAKRFYRGLASGAGIQVAFAEAGAAMRTERGGTPRDLHRHDAESADGWPWELSFRSGAEDAAAQWRLGDAAGDPLFGLPPVPPGDLPERPYRHLQWFTRSDAQVFFGRGRDIRGLYERVASTETAPITLLYGQSGVGKSSLLEAGLLPRLESAWDTRYARRDQARGLLGTLGRALDPERASTSPADVWRSLEANGGKPVLVILDQVEETYTRPDGNRPLELAEFVAALQTLFQDPVRRPRGKLVLGFRKEWLAEIETCLAEAKLPRAKVFLARLDRAGVIEAISGPAREPRLRDHYGLTIEEGLPEIVADDLLEDRESNIAPTLSILLTKMWAEATKHDSSHPRFDRDLYQALKREGVLLKDFLDQQLSELRRGWDMGHAMAEPGLALDVLQYHTTPLGTAERRAAADLATAYAHVDARMRQEASTHGYEGSAESHSGTVTSLIQACKDLSLLVDDSGDRHDRSAATRLTHDTLAPLIRQEFDNSAQPGQLARRIIESRVVEWKDGQAGTPLDERDLALVEDGALGMRAWTADESRLVEASRTLRGEGRRRHRRDLAIWGFAGLAVVVIAGFGWQQRLKREAGDAESESRDLAVRALTIYQNIGADGGRSRLGQAVKLAIDAAGRAETYEADAALRAILKGAGRERVLGHLNEVSQVAFAPTGGLILTTSRSGAYLWRTAAPWDSTPLLGHSALIKHAAFSPDGKLIATASSDNTARIWDDSTGAPLHTLSRHSADVMYTEFSPSGDRLVTAGHDRRVYLWRRDGSVVDSIALDEPVRLAVFDPQGYLIAVGGEDGAVRLWNVERHEVIRLDGHRGAVRAIAFRNDGQFLATGGADSTVHLWRLARPVVDSGSVHPAGRLVHAAGVNDVTFSPDGRELATASDDSTARRWICETGRLKDTLASRTDFTHWGFVVRVRYARDGRRLVTAGEDGMARLWDARTGREIATLGGKGPKLRDAAFSPDGRWVVTAADSGGARLHRTQMPDLVAAAESLLAGAPP
jgi:WD40 repeat protein